MATEMSETQPTRAHGPFRGRWWIRSPLFLLTVVLPTVVAAVYFGLMASDVYISESKFVVRTPERSTATPLGLLLEGAGFTRSQDDSYVVQDFMLSRDALAALDASLQVRRAFSNPEVDRLSRFPGLDWDDSFEAFHRYYQRMIDIQVDSASSITSLTVRAFTAEDALRINRELLEMSEALVNRLNERGRQDLIRFAAGEVAAAEAKAKAAALALAEYRNQKDVIDPEKQSAIPLQQIAQLQDELLATRTLIAQLERIADENPQLPPLRQRARILEAEIEAQTSRVAGGGERSLAGKAAEFTRLALDKEFADRMLASAMSTLEQARNEAQRQQLYLERIVQPIKPDYAMEPRRIRAVVATLAVGLIVFAVLTMLLASVREHLA
jgi:capsular polysaccharide transport system permease protein